jgi:hypothetical protein
MLLDYNIDPESLNTIIGYLEKPVEYCGFFEVQDDLHYHIMMNKISMGERNSGRSLCKHNRYAWHSKYGPHIWHTHRNEGKYYPSVEDIEKVIKRRSIEKSFIFVSSNSGSSEEKQIGMWVLHCNFDIRRNTRVTSGESRLIRGVNDAFYESTKGNDERGGRYFNVGAIQSYKYALNSGIAGLRIDYYIYDSSTQVFVNCI